jgi:hypothetical protein
MVYFMENPSINGRFGGTPILGNHHFSDVKTSSSSDADYE